MDFEHYAATADPAATRRIASTASPYKIEVRFLGGLNAAQKKAFKLAAERWTTVIVGDLPGVEVDNEVIDDILILAQGTDIDGPGGILGQAGPTRLRPASAGKTAYLPAKGAMYFDTADLAAMQEQKTLNDVITHEMGHVLGIGTVWDRKGLLEKAGSLNPTFRGKGARREYKALRSAAAGKNVPVENTGGSGTAGSHWRESVFKNELMSGWIGAKGNPLSRLTVASLGDLGYDVDLDAAEPYALPNLMRLAEAGLLAPPRAPGFVLPNIPVVLPDDSLI